MQGIPSELNFILIHQDHDSVVLYFCDIYAGNIDKTCGGDM